MKNNLPLISVVIPLYNHEKYIEKCINSVLYQTYDNFELIIINDGSVDNSENIVKSIADKRIRYFYQNNMGAHNAINAGIRKSNGQYVSILNSDDEFFSDKLQICLNTLEADPRLQATFSYFDIVYDDDKLFKVKTGSTDNYVNHDESTSFKADGDLLLDLLAGNYFGTTSNLFCRRSVFDSIGYFENYRYAHDYDYFLRICAKYEVHLIRKSLFKYRYHDTNTINENEAAVGYEVATILADFILLNYKVIIDRARKYDNYMVKLLNSIDTLGADRLILTLMLLCMNNDDSLVISLRNDANHPLRLEMIKYLQQLYSRNIETSAQEPTIETESSNSSKYEMIKKWLEKRFNA